MNRPIPKVSSLIDVNKMNPIKIWEFHIFSKQVLYFHH